MSPEFNDFLYKAESRLGAYPALYFALFAHRYPFKAMKVSHKTNICIEGFPRSANSYATVAFKLVNKGVKVAHHLHVAAQLLRAARYQIPAMVVLRAPEEAVSSFMVFQQSLNAPLYLDAYTRFHQRLLDVQDQLLFVSFETVVSDMNKAIRALNEKFGINFEIIPNVDQRQDEIIEKLKIVNARFFKGQHNKNMFPDKNREKLKEKARQYLLAAPELVAARNVYARLKEQAV